MNPSKFNKSIISQQQMSDIRGGNDEPIRTPDHILMPPPPPPDAQ